MACFVIIPLSLWLITTNILASAEVTGLNDDVSKVKQTTVNPDENNFLSNTSRIASANVSLNLSTNASERLSTSPLLLAETTAILTTVNHDPVLPQKGEAEEEKHSSMTIFFVLMVIALCILMVHVLIQKKMHFLPESVAIVCLGAAIGLVLKLISNENFGNWQKEEAFPPTTFFLLLLPPIIFESGYNLHKGNFFQNIGSILVFAIMGTVISALVIGGGIFLLGLADVAYKLTFLESCAFGALISAVDPVATLAIFAALDVDPVLYMLVFGESVLNDAVSIVLTSTVLEFDKPGISISSSQAVLQGIGHFCLLFFASAGIGVAFALVSALLLKHVDLRKNPSLEFGMMLVFSYAPYGLAEGLRFSGIMAILACGIVMSHYTHFNLSPVTQVTIQQTFRTMAFIAETCVFAYLGMAIFSFKHKVELPLVVWSVVLCLVGRACNIYPLAYFLNYFREHKITKSMMFFMWFSGLRGAIAYALALHLEFEDEKRHVLVTTTLCIVLFTLVVLGGSTTGLVKFLQANKRKRRRKRSGEKEISLSKTKGMGHAVDTEHLSELTEEEYEVSFAQGNLTGFLKFDVKYFIPFFTRRFTQQELNEGKTQMTDLTNQWYQAIRVSPSESEGEAEVPR